MPGGTRYQQGNEITDQVLYLSAVTFPTLAANASNTSTQSVPGVQVGDLIGWNLQAPPAHLVLDNAYVSANGTITFLWGTDGTGVTGATVNILLSVCRPENANLGLSALPAAVV